MIKIFALLSLLVVANVMSTGNGRNLEEEAIAHQIVALINNLEGDDDPQINAFSEEDDIPADEGFDDLDERGYAGSLMDGPDEIPYGSDEVNDVMKRYFIKVTRRYCPPRVECMQFRGRHQWQRCECPGSKKCRALTRTVYRCM